jgi:hypothetical protein
MVVKRKFTVQDFLDALEEDAITLARGGWTKPSEKHAGSVGAACSLSIAAINLGVDGPSLQTVLNNIAPKVYVGSEIVRLNDSGKPFKDIVAYAKTTLSPYADKEIEAESKFWLSDVNKSI